MEKMSLDVGECLGDIKVLFGTKNTKSIVSVGMI